MTFLTQAGAQVAAQQKKVAAYRGWQNPYYAFKKASSAQQQAAEKRVVAWDQSGNFKVVGLGEATQVITFNLIFIEKPVFTFGSEMAPNTSPIAGSFPTCSATVATWATQAAGHATLWTGVTVIVVVTGLSTPTVPQALYVHYSFKGKAMSGQSAAFNDTGTA